MTNLLKKDITVSKEENKIFSYLDIEDEYDSYELNFHVEEKASLKINLSIFSSIDKKVNINIYHDSDDSNSECICYGVSKKGRIDFILNTYIKKLTHGNNCTQEINGLLLSNESHISGNPNLIIDSNKIKASHKLAIGAFDKDNLFYLMSKGISEQNAKLLIANKFYQFHLENIDDENRRSKVLNMIKGYFNYEF